MSKKLIHKGLREEFE